MTYAACEARVPLRLSPRAVNVVAADPASLQEQLDSAVEQLRSAAAAGDPRGVLVTRWSWSLFTVEASADVPYGITLEKDRWRRPGSCSQTGGATAGGAQEPDGPAGCLAD